MDIWEANSISAAYTPHVCSVKGQYRCSGTECGDGDERYQGVCDKDGCDFNSYRQGNTTFYGPGMTVDTNKKFTVVTQFITSDGTSSGQLTEIRRKYVQNGAVIENSVSNIAGMDAVNSITDTYCNAQKSVFGDDNSFEKYGGLATMGDSLTNGMVLTLSVWDDHAVNMLWLDSTYPTDSTSPGAARGTCATDSGNPDTIEKNAASIQVVYSNIRYGDLDSTYSTTGTSTGSTGGDSGSGSSTGGCTVAKYGQCGGQGYTGCTSCASGSTCTTSNQYYSQCL
jgi:cellulose 1,4-beta-cellobiosidase